MTHSESEDERPSNADDPSRRDQDRHDRAGDSPGEGDSGEGDSAEGDSTNRDTLPESIPLAGALPPQDDDDSTHDEPGPASFLRPYDAPLSDSATTGRDSSGAAPSESDAGYTLKDPPAAWQHAGPDWHRVEKIDTARPSPRQRRRKKSRGGVLGIMGCNLIVFMASVCVMVLELTASRLIARHVGSSIYTWTSVIGVVLAGITVGNFFGGIMADRFDRHRTLPRLFLLASVACLSVLWLDRIAAGQSRPDDIDWPMWVFLTVAEMFFLPALALGMISPVVASIAIDMSRQTGFTVGNVYAWGAFGSIVGTFLTGFWLIDLFGTRMIIGGTSAVLAVLGAAVASNQILFRTAVCVGWLQFLIVTTTAAAATSQAGGQIGEVIGRWNADTDAAIVGLADWYESSWRTVLSQEVRDDLLMRSRSGVLPPLNDEDAERLRRWLRGGGHRDRLNSELRDDLEAVIQAGFYTGDTVENWTNRGANLGYHLHELGLGLGLRTDRTGEYHDESVYSYINVSNTEIDGDTVRQLRLDKLVHSYFNPEKPTKLYYEYEEIYAELTERAASGWSRETSVPVELFEDLKHIANELPERTGYDPDSGELSIQGAMTPARRRELIEAAPYGEFWLAVEELAEESRDPLWAGLSSTRLRSLPPGATNDGFFSDRLTFEPQFETLNCFRVLTDEDVARLCSAGAAGRTIAWKNAVDALEQRSRVTSTFFIGGGGFVFPRWIEHRFSDQSRIDVAELDPAVRAAVRKEMGLPPDNETAIRTLIGDARNIVDDRLRKNAGRIESGRDPVQYDFIYGDAFNDFSVPWHLTTLEFNRKIKQLLHPEDGVYLINVIDAWPLTLFSPGGLKEHGSESGPEHGQESRREHGQDDDKSEAARGFRHGIPEALQLEPGEVLRWQFAPQPFNGIEVLAHDDGRYQFAVRGVMPDALRDRLLAAATGEGSSEFKAAVKAAWRRSKNTEAGRFLGSCAATLGEVFPHVYVFSTAHGTPADVRDTYVIVASLQPISLDRLPHDGRHWDTPPFASLHTDADGEPTSTGQMTSLLSTSRGLILTDDFAPVDNLLRPVFE